MTNVQLQYSSEPKSRSKRLVIIVAITLFCVIGLLYLADALNLEAIIRWRIPYLRNQSACLRWVIPSGQIAYSEDPTEAQRLSGGHVNGPGFTTLSDTGHDTPQNHILGFYSHADPLEQMYYPESGFQMVDQKDAVLLLHGRRAKGGQVRLICVRVDNFFPLRSGTPGSVAWSMMSALECEIVQLGGIRTAPKILSHFTWSDPLFGVQTPKPTRIFFGVPDPVDESKFSILFQTPAETKVIEARLLPNDTLQFQIVAAPNSMTPRAPSTNP